MPMAVTPEPAKRRKTGGCAGKVQYRNRKAALTVVSQMRAAGADDSLEAYHCGFHHCWHVGNAPNSPKTKTEPRVAPQFSGRMKGKVKRR